MPRVALVTGGSGALGQAIVHRFLHEGDIVCVPWIVEAERARLEGSLEATTRGRVMLERCDVSDEAAMTRLAATVVDKHHRRPGSVPIPLGGHHPRRYAPFLDCSITRTNRTGLIRPGRWPER